MNLKANWKKFWRTKVFYIYKTISKYKLFIKVLANINEPNSENPHEHELTEKDFFNTIEIAQKFYFKMKKIKNLIT